MKNNKRWIAVTALAGVTAVALTASVLVKNNMNKGPENAIAITQEAMDSGIKTVEALKDDNDNITGYKVNVDAKGFGDPAMDLVITVNETADTITALEVNDQHETDGLGGNVTKPEFLNQFSDIKLPVYTEGMDNPAGTQVDAISGATLTTNAVIIAINNAYEYLLNSVVK